MRDSKKVFFIGGIICLLVAMVGSLVLGSRYVSMREILTHLFDGEYYSFSMEIVKERIPRTIFCLLAGGSLGVAGSLMQAVTRNPIADPGILGVNTGASLFVVSGIAFFNISTASQYIWFALVGAGITAVVVYLIGSMGYGGATPIKLALAGTTISIGLSSIVSAIVLPRDNVMNTFRFWQIGSVSGATWEGIGVVLPFIIIGLIIGVFTTPSLNAMAMGEAMATGLGVKTARIQLLAAFAGVLLCGATTAIAGPIGFIGLMVPHMIKGFLGTDLRFIIPAVFIGGGILLTIADIIGRLIGTPGELEAGIVTAFLGAPVLIYIALKKKGDTR